MLTIEEGWWILRKMVEDFVMEFNVADGKVYTFGETKHKFFFLKTIYHRG